MFCDKSTDFLFVILNLYPINYDQQVAVSFTCWFGYELRDSSMLEQPPRSAAL